MTKPKLPTTPQKLSPQAQAQKYFEQAIFWITQNQERFWAIVGGIIIVIVVGILMVRNRAVLNEEAWNQLGIIQGEQFQGKTAEALKGLVEWQTKFPTSSAASYSKFMKADLLIKTTDYPAAAAQYAELATTAQPAVLQPLALAGQVNAEELAGQIPQARAAAQSFLEKYPDHYMAGTILFTQGRLAEKAGDSAAAAAIYDRFALLYAQNPWADLVTARQNALKNVQPAAPLSTPR